MDLKIHGQALTCDSADAQNAHCTNGVLTKTSGPVNLELRTTSVHTNEDMNVLARGFKDPWSGSHL